MEAGAEVIYHPEQALDDMVAKVYTESKAITEEDLKLDHAWQYSSEVVSNYLDKQNIPDNEMGLTKKGQNIFKAKDPLELAQRGLDIMSAFEFNTAKGANLAHLVTGADKEVAQAFAYMMKRYDDKDISMAGIGRFFKEIGQDPLNYVFGGGFMGGKAIQQGAKATFMEALKMKLAEPVVQGAIAGAGYSGISNVQEQSIKQSAGLQDGINAGELATNMAVGATVGGGLVKGVQAVGKGIDNFVTSTNEDMARLAGGGTPPQVGDFPKMFDNALNGSEPIQNPDEMIKLAKQNPNYAGQALIAKAQKEQRSKRMMEWHKNSAPETKNDDGSPKVFYHGTSSKFIEFDPKKTNDTLFWFTSNKSKLDNGEAGASGHGIVMPVYLNAKKLAGWDEYEKYYTDDLIRQGYEGIKLDDDIVMFNPKNIKSVFNKGTFDEKDANILKGLGISLGAIGATQNQDEGK